MCLCLSLANETQVDADSLSARWFGTLVRVPNALVIPRSEELERRRTIERFRKQLSKTTSVNYGITKSMRASYRPRQSHTW